MAKLDKTITGKDECYLNVTLQNDEDKKDEVIISFGTIFKMLKKFLAIWLVAAIIVAIMIPVCASVFIPDKHKNLSALVSFNFDGIEQGLAPDGTRFDAYSIKNPSVIESALTELDLPLTSLEGIRQGITIEGIIPADADKRITMYKNIYEQNNLTAGEKMLEVSYFPTQYRITFNYSASGLNGRDAVSVFNTMLTKYREYFFKQYGFNQALGSVVKSQDYTTYDYAEAVDIFDNTLRSLQDYVDNLSSEDTTRFRSVETGYSFPDLSDTIATLQNVDLDLISSYVTINTVTKDKNTLVDYYNYRIETLTREKNVAQENLKMLNESIAGYQKDTIVIYGGDGQENSQYSQASAAYDEMYNKKIMQTDILARKTQEITMYQQRIASLKGKTAASQDKMDKVEKDLDALNVKINTLMDAVNDTANEYYETVYLSNAYSVLVPASYSSLGTTKNVIKSSMSTVLIAEALILVIFLGTAFVLAIVSDNRKKAEQVMEVVPETVPAEKKDEEEDAEKANK